MRHGIVGFAFVLAAGLLLDGDLRAGSLEPPGPPAPTMKTLQQIESRVAITSLPITISTPGSYYLTGDLTGISGQTGITITASFVTLDLNGFSLIGVPGSFDGIRNNGAGLRQIVIRNGTVRNWGGSGIFVDTVTEVHAEDLRLHGNGGSGLLVGRRSVVRNTTSTGNGLHGIYTVDGTTIVGCTAGNNTASGFVTGANSAVSSSTASSNGESGFLLGTAGVATDCTAQQNVRGFLLNQGSRIRHSVAQQNAIGILVLGDGATIEDCTVEANTDDGIQTSNRAVVRHNVARGNANDGIQAGGSANRIEDNESTTNGVGIRVSGVNNLIVKNSVNGNISQFLIVGGNKVGTISTDPTTANPWANFDM